VGQGHTPIEIEGSLAVVGQSRAALLLEVAGLRTVAGYALQARPDQEIHDIYYDTEDSDLIERSLSVRLRTVNGESRVTLKANSPAEGTPQVKVRAEIELPWSMEARDRILGELALRGLDLTCRRPHDAGDPAAAHLRAWGLVPIQDRETARLVRVLVDPSAPDEDLAEMALDTVTYHLGAKSPVHREIEVELIGSRDAALIIEVAAWLIESYPGRLLQWSLAKLTLGVILQRLVADGLVGDEEIATEAYEAILQAARAAELP
jgi:inorganic triphosphatase YgiF